MKRNENTFVGPSDAWEQELCVEGNVKERFNLQAAEVKYVKVRPEELSMKYGSEEDLSHCLTSMSPLLVSKESD